MIILKGDIIMNKLKIFENEEFGQLSVIVKNNKEYTMLDIEILTGRKNQIRVHMESINHPIVGDKKYNSKKNPIRRMCLHAYYIEFIHPITNKKIIIEDKYPKIFDTLVEKCKQTK